VRTTAKGRCAVFHNQQWRIDQDLAHHVSVMLSTTAMTVELDETPGGENFAWTVYSNGDVKRSIWLENDPDEDGWKFASVGTPYPFEDVQRCGEQRKRERLDGALLKRYLRELGLAPFGLSFYKVGQEAPLHRLEMRW
jgi:hypothetical protein